MDKAAVAILDATCEPQTWICWGKILHVNVGCDSATVMEDPYQKL